MRAVKFALATVSLAAILLMGCQQLFTTSLASALARPSLSIPTNLSTSQASDLAAQAKDNQDTKLATALLESLNTEIGNTTDTATKADLEQSAAEAAVVASGAGSALLSALSDFANGTNPDSSQISSIVSQLQADSSADIATGLSYLATLDPTKVDQSSVNATDYVLAAAALAASSPALGPGVDPTTLAPGDPYFSSSEYLAAQAIIANAKLLPGADTSAIDQLASFMNL
ncbi:MAG TPA: hypothetical protein VMC79_14525 [Rectinemataceae bacterium]|nr:hypothetical protein [Rectinemataceae bacterium]